MPNVREDVIKWCSYGLAEITRVTEDICKCSTILNMHPTEGHTGVYQKTMTVFMATLFVIAPNWEYQMSVAVERRINYGILDNRLLHSDENKTITKATTRMDLTGILEAKESNKKQSLLHDSTYIKLKKKIRIVVIPKS